jgi:dolichol kinase/membrane-associated phospholipid phosphatase
MGLNNIWHFISFFGDVAYWMGFASAFIIIYPFLEKRSKRKQRWILYYLLPAIVLSSLSSFFLKLIFKIPRICEGVEYCPETYAFPSGHSTVAFSLFTISLLHFKDIKIYLPLFFLAILVSYSRLALKVHTLSDVIGGALVGILVSSFWYYFFRRIENRKNGTSFYFRKLIHLLGIAVIFLRLTVETKYISALLFSLTSLFFVSELLRLREINLPIFYEISEFCKKKEERGFLVEPFFFALSLFLLLYFPLDFFIVGSVSLVIGDGLAGLIGYRFGSHKLFYNKNKSVEGSVAFFISTLISFLLFFDVKISFILALFSTILESILKKYENLILPFGCVLFYFGLSKTIINIF